MIAGMVAIRDFPLAAECVADLAARVQTLSLWIDQHADPAIVRACRGSVPRGCRLQIVKAKAPWGRWNWREDLIRSLDQVRPAYVLAPDSDERFSDGFDADFAAFQKSGRDLMMFSAEMVTDDGRAVVKYPAARHCKAFRWRQGLTYHPYPGYARPGIAHGKLTVYPAATPIRHFCCWTREMEAGKRWHR